MLDTLETRAFLSVVAATSAPVAAAAQDAVIAPRQAGHDPIPTSIPTFLVMPPAFARSADANASSTTLEAHRAAGLAGVTPSTAAVQTVEAAPILLESQDGQDRSHAPTRPAPLATPAAATVVPSAATVVEFSFLFDTAYHAVSPIHVSTVAGDASLAMTTTSAADRLPSASAASLAMAQSLGVVGATTLSREETIGIAPLRLRTDDPGIPSATPSSVTTSIAAAGSSNPDFAATVRGAVAGAAAVPPPVAGTAQGALPEAARTPARRGSWMSSVAALAAGIAFWMHSAPARQGEQA